MSVCGYMFVRAGVLRGQKRCRSPRAEVIGVCKLPDMGSGNQTQVLDKDSTCSETSEPSLQPLDSIHLKIPQLVTPNIIYVFALFCNV